MGVAIAKKQLMSQFECDKISNMDKYVGCKVDRDWDQKAFKLTQPVMIRSFQDEFPTKTDGHT